MQCGLFSKKRFIKIHKDMSINLENVEHESAQEDEDGVDNANKRISFQVETERNGMVKKIFFDEGVDEKKRKQVKSKLLTENKGILLLDMTQERHLKSGTTDTIACDILTITNGPIEFNALKKEIQDYSTEGYIVSQPYDIPEGERIIVKKVDSKKQEVKFLIVSFYNRESKVMLQGNHKHLKCVKARVQNLMKNGIQNLICMHFNLLFYKNHHEILTVNVNHYC